MDLKIDFIIQSHLSDAIIETDNNAALARKRIRYVKHLLAIKEDEKIERISEERLKKIWLETVGYSEV